MSSRLLKNEEDTKLKIVFEYLTSLGFDESELFFEETFFLKVGRFTFKVDTNEEVRGLQPRLDILIKRDDKNLCIVEVKDGKVEIGNEDIDQAVSYARLVHPIAPICIVTNGRDWRLVNTISKEEITKDSLPDIMKYEPSLPADEYYEALEHFLGYSPQNLRTFCTEQVVGYMEPLKGSPRDRDKKFIPQLYEARHELQKKLDEFMASDSNCFAVVGNSGRGKTCWVCDSALRYLEEGYAVFFYRGSDIETGLFQALSEDLNWTFSARVDEVEGIRRLLGLFKHSGVLFFVDGLDEMDAANARKVLDTFLRRAEGTPVKLIATCKSAAWGTLLEFDGIPTLLASRVFGGRGGNDISMGFDSPEFYRVVMKYRDFYNYTGAFESSVLDACKSDPFLLRVVFEVAIQQNLPYMDYSVIAFHRHYLDQLSRRFGTNKDKLRRYLINIADCFFVRNADELDVDVLLGDLNIPLHESLPTEFFNLNILERHERGDSTYVRFYFERLRDYLIAFRARKWQNLSASSFSKAVESLDLRSVHLDVLNLYYSLAKDEHKRAIDGSLYENAQLYVQTYQAVLDEQFRAFKDRFLPHTFGEIGFLGGIDIAQPTITWHGVRPIANAAESVTLLPGSKGALSASDDNSAHLRGALRRTWSSRAKGFQDADAVRELAWSELQSSLKEIIEQGRLDESQNRMLLIERVIAISFSKYKDYFSREGGPAASLPIDLANLREFALYKLNRQILTVVYVNEAIAQGNAKETRDGNIVVSTVGLPPDVSAALEVQARDTARRREDLSLSHSQIVAEPAARALLNGIASLKRLGITQIQSTPLTDWYTAQLIRRTFFADSRVMAELEGLLPHLYQTFLDEYRTLVEVNFPLLCRDFSRYKTLPVRALVAIEAEHAGGSPVALATLPIRILECKQDSLSSNKAVLSSTDEISEAGLEGRSEPALGGTPIREMHTGKLMNPYRSYLPTTGVDRLAGIDRHFCLLRNLVYDEVQSDAIPAFRSLSAQRIAAAEPTR